MLQLDLLLHLLGNTVRVCVCCVEDCVRVLVFLPAGILRTEIVRDDILAHFHLRYNLRVELQNEFLHKYFSFSCRKLATKINAFC